MPSVCMDGCRVQGVPATSINFGPFGGVGMAAQHAGSMRNIGLHPLSPPHCHKAFVESGAAISLVYVHMDIAKFSKVNTARGPWPFLNQLAHIRKQTQADRALPPAPLAVIPAARAVQAAAQAPAVPLETVVQMVRNAASEILREDIGADGHFAAGHFDSLAAVELSNSLGKVKCGLLAFYPLFVSYSDTICKEGHSRSSARVDSLRGN